MNCRCKLEQLECLHSKDTPVLPYDYPFYWFNIGSQVKTRQSQSYKFKEFAKTSNFLNFEQNYTLLTFWSCLIRYVNMKRIQEELLKMQSGHDCVHRWTDGQTDKVKQVYPTFNFVEAWGIIKPKVNRCVIIINYYILFNNSCLSMAQWNAKWMV